MIEEKEKIKSNFVRRKTGALLVALFLAFGIYNDAQAASCYQDLNTIKNLNPKPAGVCYVTIRDYCVAKDKDECDQICKERQPAGMACTFSTLSNITATDANGKNNTQTSQMQRTSGPAQPETFGELAKLGESALEKAFKVLLIGIFNVVGWLVGVAATLFAWAVDPVNMSGANGMLNKQAVKDVWIMVRDLLNMGFIVVLLFAAFGTIFQMNKWNIKNIWLNVLINALLVNFSYPIARIIIDISNVAFYYFLNNLFSPNGTTAVSGSTIFASFGSASNISKTLLPGNYSDYPVAYLVASIIVLFILGMTLLVIAGLFVSRLVGLTMLIMLSPIGFVGYAIPSMSKHADDWWKKLFNYAFFAPIMVFVMNISLRIMEALKNDNLESMRQQASTNAPGISMEWIANAAFFVIPIMILWAGIGLAKSFGIAGADYVVKKVKGGGKWLAHAPGKYSGVYGATKKASEDFNKKGKLFGKKVPFMGTEGREQREARWAAFATGGKGAYNDNVKKLQDTKIADKIKEYKDRNYSSDQVSDDLKSDDKVKSAAALRFLMAEKGSLAHPERMEQALRIAGTDMALRNKIIENNDGFAGHDKFEAANVGKMISIATSGLEANDPRAKEIEDKIKGKIRKENIKKLVDYEISQRGAQHTDTIYQEHFNKLSAEEFGKQKGIHEKIGTDVNLQNYVLNHVANDPSFHQEMFKHMKKAAREEYVNHQFQP